jgi:hypothetical protein
MKQLGDASRRVRRDKASCDVVTSGRRNCCYGAAATPAAGLRLPCEPEM